MTHHIIVSNEKAVKIAEHTVGRRPHWNGFFGFVSASLLIHRSKSGTDINWENQDLGEVLFVDEKSLEKRRINGNVRFLGREWNRIK